MSTEVKAPVFPESIEEGTVMTWLKQPGDAVAADDKLAEIETDKVVLEVAAQSDGVLESILKQEGDTVKSGELIGTLGSGEGRAAPPPDKPAPKQEAPEPTPVPAPPEPTPAPTPPPTTESSETASPHGVSPAARKIMAEHSIDPSAVQGTGRQGRISKEDVLTYLADHALGTQPSEVIQQAPEPAPKPAPAPKPTPAPAPKPATPAPVQTPSGTRQDERVPMSRLRARIAQRLVDAQQSMALLTTFNEVNMKPAMDLRTRYKADFEKKHGVKLGFMSFFVQAAAEALRRFPAVNASIEDNDIVYHHYYDIGIAVSSPRGLLVPVLRDVDQLSFSETEARIRDFGARAQDNQIQIDELLGGTFTISNGGVFGSLLSTPIVNPPQSAILGMHAINDRPVAENGEVVIRPMMNLALTYDHRIIDGREAVQFLVTIKDILEDPARLLLQV